MTWWRRTSSSSTPITDPNPCPICVHLNQWYGEGPVRASTHGAGGPEGQWRACYEHYKVISAFEWIGLTT